MARLRSQTAPVPAGPPRFVMRDWYDEAADGPVPESWRDREGMWHQIRAFKRYLAVRLGRSEPL